MEESLMMLEMQLKEESEDNDFIQEFNFKTSVSDNSERGGEIQDEVPQHEVVLVFPEGESDSVRIINSDIESLQPGEFLSGNLVDFYIKYLLKRLSSTSQSRFHSFKSSFYSELVKTHGATKSEQCEASFEKDLLELTGEINIFEKAYVFIPVNQSSHWSLIIICYLDSLTNSPAKLKGAPCILHLDSVEGKHTNLEGHIRNYLRNAWRHWRARYQDLNENLFQMRYRKVKVPQQANNYECGIYLLEFVEPDPPSEDQCRLRYDTLLKAYKKSYDYCMKNDKQFSELPLGGLKLATYLSEDWYNAIDELCRRLPHGSSKRRKFSLQSSDDNSSVQHHSFSLSASRYMSATSCSTAAFSRHSRLRPCSDSSSVETDSDSSSVGSDSDSNLVENDQASTTPRNSLTFVLFLEGTTLPAPYRLATVQEVQANQKALFQAMPRWQIANLADGSVTGKLYGGHTKAERRNDVHHQLATSYPIICKGTEPIQEDYELIARDISYPGFLPYSTVESIKREAAIRAVITKKGSSLKFPKPKNGRLSAD